MSGHILKLQNDLAFDLNRGLVLLKLMSETGMVLLKGAS